MLEFKSISSIWIVVFIRLLTTKIKVRTIIHKLLNKLHILIQLLNIVVKLQRAVAKLCTIYKCESIKLISIYSKSPMLTKDKGIKHDEGII